VKVAIVGSRDWHWDFKGEKPSLENNYWCGGPVYRVDNFISDVVGNLKEEDYVVTGGATGADWWGERFATVMRVSRSIHIPAWAKYGTGAGPTRNSLIVKEADCLFAFFTDRNKSRGTLDSVTKAHDKGIPVYEFDAATEEVPLWIYTWYDEMAGLSGESQESPRHIEQPRG